ncbi:MAG TPA: beta-propeller fold lactonase family protein, partial [Thermomicrobiaceae bacterium]|nr:beta-propeller fold lactonase family protein [Thermomicrobiaceae bacterium]
MHGLHAPRRRVSPRLILVLALVMSAFAFALSGAAAGASGTPGAVYAITNAAAGNALAVFDRAPNGTLTAAGQVAAGGLGTGSGLGSQGAVAVSDNGRWVFAVDAGSDQVSVFRVTPSGPVLVDVAGSGGTMPSSLTQSGDLLYVLNAGGAGNITGFHLSPSGQLTMISGSTEPLSGSATNPAQVSFAANGRVLVVTERATNLIDTYTVDAWGRAGTPDVQASVGMTPYGFAADNHGHLFVSEATTGAVSSYEVDRGGMLEVVSPSVVDHQAAACWVALGRHDRFAYTTNAHSNSISGFRIGDDGQLTLLDASGVTATTGPAPTDLATSGNGQYLYARNSDGTISAYWIMPNGELQSIAGATGLPASASGLAG